MKILAPSEAACVYCRLGWLNVYNPCKPEGAWELDMARREERVVAKTLCVLATNEPGDNWVYETFRWMRSMESMPGWELVRIPVDSIIFIISTPRSNLFFALYRPSRG
jgi:anti-sigma factor RsiW